jgi:hypothetical protein
MKLGDMVRRWIASGKPSPPEPDPDPEPEPELTPYQERTQWLEEEYRKWQLGKLPSQQRRRGPGPLERASRGEW